MSDTPKILYLGLVVITRVNICSCACLPSTVRLSTKTKPNMAGFHSSRSNLSNPRYNILEDTQTPDMIQMYSSRLFIAEDESEVLYDLTFYDPDLALPKYIPAPLSIIIIIPPEVD